MGRHDADGGNQRFCFRWCLHAAIRYGWPHLVIDAIRHGIAGPSPALPRACATRSRQTRARISAEVRRGVEMVSPEALALGGRPASFSDSLEISRVWPPRGFRKVDPVAKPVRKDRVLDRSLAPISPWGREMLVGRIPVAVFGERLEVRGTTQLFGTAALGHPALHLCDVASLRGRDEDARDTQASELLGHFRTSRRVQRWSCHAERVSPTSRGTPASPEAVGLSLASRFSRKATVPV